MPFPETSGWSLHAMREPGSLLHMQQYCSSWRMQYTGYGRCYIKLYNFIIYCVAGLTALLSSLPTPLRHPLVKRACMCRLRKEHAVPVREVCPTLRWARAGVAFPWRSPKQPEWQAAARTPFGKTISAISFPRCTRLEDVLRAPHLNQC